MKDPAFRPKAALPRARAAFSDHEVVQLHDASHYIQEDAPEAIADAIRSRFLKEHERNGASRGDL